FFSATGLASNVCAAEIDGGNNNPASATAHARSARLELDERCIICVPQLRTARPGDSGAPGRLRHRAADWLCSFSRDIHRSAKTDYRLGAQGCIRLADVEARS